MRSKVLILIAALALGLLAAFATGRYLSDARSQIEADAEPVAVYVATQDLPKGMSSGELLDKGYIKTQEVPRRFVSDGAISVSAAIADQVLASDVAKGEQLTKARFQLRTQAGLGYTVPADYLAVMIPGEGVRGLTGLLKPGDYVAVLATFEPDEGRIEDAFTKIILRKVKVLAIDSDTTESAETSPTASGGGGVLGGGSRTGTIADTLNSVTLAVTPVEAEKLVFAREEGRVWLALISSQSTSVPATPGIRYPQAIQ